VRDITAGSRDLSGEVLSVADLLDAGNWPPAVSPRTTRSWPSGPPPTAPGRSGTWSWARHKSS